jgi:hypothetical protein
MSPESVRRIHTTAQSSLAIVPAVLTRALVDWYISGSDMDGVGAVLGDVMAGMWRADPCQKEGAGNASLPIELANL